MKRFQIKLMSATLLLCSSLLVHAADDICASASLVNPNTQEDGVGSPDSPAKGGFGGTGITTEHGNANSNEPVAKSGFGGTGMVADNLELLPNDAQGGIAIMGVVTGFASICVNGEEVHYDNSTPVFSNGKPAKLGYLAVGKTVMLKAERVNNRLNAKAIGLYDAVSGPMSGLDITRQQMHVMGQTVRMNAQVLQQAQAIRANVAVSVSGHRLATGEIVATRVDPIESTSASTIGVVTALGSNGFNINGTKVNVMDAKLLNNLKVGSEVRVSGSWSGDVLKANQVDNQPTQRLISRADSAILEGYVSANANSGGKLLGSELSFTQGNARSKELEQSNGKLVKIELRRNERGDWVYDKVEERKGRMFDKHGDFGKGSENADRETGSNSGSNSGSGHGSNSGSGHDSSSGSGHGSGSNSGSSGRDISTRSSGSGSSHGGSIDRASSQSGSSGRSSGSGGSDNRSGRGSGKYK